MRIQRLSGLPTDVMNAKTCASDFRALGKLCCAYTLVGQTLQSILVLTRLLQMSNGFAEHAFHSYLLHTYRTNNVKIKTNQTAKAVQNSEATSSLTK